MRESGLPRWLNVSWWITYPPAAVFVGWTLYESIYLTLRHGGQVVVGFAFLHTHPFIFLLSILGLFLIHLWLMAALVSVLLRPARVSRVDWLKIGLAGLALALLYLPVQKLFSLP